MTLLSASPIIDQAVKAICGTLVNSLWQGVILAAVAGLIVVFTKRATSALRYNLLTIALLLFTVGTVVTFFTEFKAPQAALVTPVAHQTVNNFSPQVIIQPFRGNVVIHPAGVLDILSDYLNTYHNTIVLIWFLIICAKSIQFGTGLYGTFRLKRTQVAAIDRYWKERTHQLACLLAIDEAIDILESGLAKVPMVVGHLKPVILVPIGLINALSAEEVEAILIHELAHIKRRDYLVNVLQSIAEIVFFFNPAVLWISQLIKAERENCCDDMVLEQNSSKVSYIRALVTCEEYQASVPAYAMALPGSRNTLLERVKRLATDRNNSLNLFEKTFLAICLVISGLCVSAFAAKDHIKHTVHEVVKALEHTITNKDDQKLAEQTMLLQKQATLTKVNTVLLKTTYVDFKLQVDTTKKLHQLNLAPMAISIPAPNVQLSGIMVNPNVNLAPINVQLAPMNVKLAPMNVAVNLAAPNVQLASMNVNLAPMNVNLSPLNVHVDLSGIDTINYMNSAYMRRFREIARELFKRKLLTDTNNAGISLNEKELIVNGVKQSDEIHKEIFEKFGNKEAYSGMYYNDGKSHSMNYNSSGGTKTYSTGVSVGTGSSNGNTYTNSYSNTYSNPGNGATYNDADKTYGRAKYPSSSSSSSSSSGYGATYTYNSSDPDGIYSSSYSSNGKGKYTYAGTPPRPVSGRYSSDRRITESDITEDLIKDGLIKDADNATFTFILTTKEFLFNGKKQSDAIFEKYKKKYIPADADANWTWAHSHSSNGQ